jgi:hypothetical protein
MQLSTFKKIVLAVAYAAGVVLAGTVHWWMAFGLIWLGAASVLLAIHFRWRARHQSTTGTSDPGMKEHGLFPPRLQALKDLEEFEKDNNELATNPLYKRYPGNIWHGIEKDRDLG